MTIKNKQRLRDLFGEFHKHIPVPKIYGDIGSRSLARPIRDPVRFFVFFATEDSLLHTIVILSYDGSNLPRQPVNPPDLSAILPFACSQVDPAGGDDSSESCSNNNGSEHHFARSKSAV